MVAHVLVPIGLCFGINLLVAWLLYARRPQDLVNIWWLPSTLAGDLAVTIFITVGLTYVVDSFAVHGDVKNGLLEAQRPPSWVSFRTLASQEALNENTSSIANKNNAFWRTLGSLNGFFIELPRPSTTKLPRFLFQVVLRAVLLGALVFLPFWGVGVGVLYGLPTIGTLNGSPVYENWMLPGWFKATFGAILGGLTTPWIAWMALARCWLWNELNERETAGAVELDTVSAGGASDKVEEREQAKVEGENLDKGVAVPQPALTRP